MPRCGICQPAKSCENNILLITYLLLYIKNYGNFVNNAPQLQWWDTACRQKRKKVRRYDRQPEFRLKLGKMYPKMNIQTAY